MLAANAVLDVFVATADSAMLPLVVQGEGRLTANALNGQVGQVARLVGGATGGVIAAAGAWARSWSPTRRRSCWRRCWCS